MEGASLNLKDVKSRIDGNELDLSVMELASVPVKHIASLKKVTSLDLSRNLLETVGAEFASQLNSLTKLDLSHNQMAVLPDNFGQLSTLQQLDLSDNRLETLPVSFGRLKQLKWLDLKGNPLEEEIAKAAGDCLDAGQCRQAAARVVKLLHNRQSEQERDRQRRLDAAKKVEAEKLFEDETKRREQQQQKKRERDRKKLEKNRRATHPSNNVASTAFAADRTERTANGRLGVAEKRVGNARKRNFFPFGCALLLLKTLLYAAVLCLGSAALGSFVVYQNCAQQQRFIPKSDALCRDIQLTAAGGVLPASAANNLRTALVATGESLRHAAADYAAFLVQIDYANATGEAFQGTSRFVVKSANAARQLAVETQIQLTRTKKFVQDDTGPLYNRISRSASEYSKAGWQTCVKCGRYLTNKAFDFTELFLEKTSLAAKWTVSTTGHLWERRWQYWEKAKFYWQNMK